MATRISVVVRESQSLDSCLHSKSKDKFTIEKEVSSLKGKTILLYKHTSWETQNKMPCDISTNKAVWRILGFPIHERQPTVERLAIPLENGQRVVFNETNLADRAENPLQTTLTAFFQLCEEDPFAKTLLYVEIPQYYTGSQKKWIRRIRGKAVPSHAGIFKGDALGILYTIDIRNKECYCVRLLLYTKRGPTSFTDLRTVNGKECDTFQQACLLLGLLEDDSHWHDTLTEASLSSSPGQFRHLFAIMIAETPSCNIHKNTDKANVLKQAKLIVWDKCTMAHKNALQAFKMALQDIRDSPKLFCGVTLLIAGDFRQTLPIITGGTPADELDACLKSSHLWGGVSTLHLNTNMRVRFEGDHSSETFSNQLLEIGKRNIPSIDGYKYILNEFANIVPNVEGLKQSVYPNLHENYKKYDWPSWHQERAILAPRNDKVI
ncbi:hypothetical protein ACOMHN_017462 [Nucella lapillus]